ncbi:low affinity immunoglobulin gamma Fc region receptor II-c-like protein [Labeo rohita]|nr:low affinity immunoglobulin gamma Fc region receptor II-c-like protein [Labeo rohita]
MDGKSYLSEEVWLTPLLVLISNIYSQHTGDIVSGATELTNAEIELKSREKQKKTENKGKTTESSDTVYYNLTLVTHQGECQNKNINHNSQGAAENCIYKYR